MSRCFSIAAAVNWCFKYSNFISGLRSTLTDLGDGTVMHCWVPKIRRESKPNLLLIHGFGANSMWQWSDTVSRMSPHFNIYVRDLVFFGYSFTTRPDRSESFQALCVMRVMEQNSVRRMRVVGLSYGGFVAYSMAAQFGEAVEKLVICCAGVCLEEKDVAAGLFPVRDVEEAADILVPCTAEKMRELLRYTFVRPPKGLPSCFLDFIDVMWKEHVELICALAKDRKLSDLPKISQPTLIVWGDQVFPLELAHRLKRHLGENAQLVVIKDIGHAFIVEKPKELYKHLKAFLVDSSPPLPRMSSPMNHK